MRLSRRAGMFVLPGVALFILSTLVVAVLVPGAESVRRTEGEAEIFFQAERRLVLAYGTCIDVEWQVEGIREAYVNDAPVVGSGQRRLCVDKDTQPVLRVVTQDGTDHYYSLHIDFLLASPLAWIALFTAVLALLVSIYLWGLNRIIVLMHPVWKRRAAIGRNLVMMAFGLFLSALVLEIGLRIYLSQAGTEGERISYLYSREKLDKIGAQYIGLPYLNYTLSPYYEGHNSMGFRGPEIALPKPDGVFRIVTVGASTTYGFFLDDEETYPAQLQQVLREEYGYENVEVINAGVPYYTSWDALVNIAFRIPELEPDLVILYEAINDLYARNVLPDCYQSNNPMRGLNPIAGIWREQNEALSPSVLVRYIGINMGWMTDPNSLQKSGIHAPDIKCGNGETISFEDALAANPPMFFERNLRNIITLARANDMEIMFSSFAYYPGSDVMTAYMKAGVDEYNIMIQQLAEEMDVPFYDLMAGLDHDNPDYWEWTGYHQSPVAARDQAHQFAAFIVEQGLLPGGDQGQ